MSVISTHCTHYHPCRCPILAVYADRPLRRDELSPEWLQRPIDDEDDNKAIAAKMKRQRWRYRMKNIGITLQNIFLKRAGKTERPPEVRSFRWLISSHHVTEGYQNGTLKGQPPWRMLMRCYFMDLHKQLGEEAHKRSIKKWRKCLAIDKEKFYDRTKLDEAPPNITCGRRVVFSLQRRDTNRTVGGDWLVVIYLWAASREWAEKVDVRSLVSFSSVFGIRAWEWVDAVDVPFKIPYLFYELKREDSGGLSDAVYGGLPYRDYDTVPLQPGDPVPGRLSDLRHLMNGQARDLLYADHERTVIY